MLITKPAFLSGDGFSAFLGEFRFHRFAHFALDLLKGAFTLEFVACGKVGLLSEDALSKFLVSDASITSDVATKALFFAVSGTHVPFLFRAGAVCPSDLSTQGCEAAAVMTAPGWPRFCHANPIPTAAPPMMHILVSSYIR
jgi:hypothetical protein